MRPLLLLSLVLLCLILLSSPAIASILKPSLTINLSDGHSPSLISSLTPTLSTSSTLLLPSSNPHLSTTLSTRLDIRPPPSLTFPNLQQLLNLPKSAHLLLEQRYSTSKVAVTSDISFRNEGPLVANAVTFTESKYSTAVTLNSVGKSLTRVHSSHATPFPFLGATRLDVRPRYDVGRRTPGVKVAVGNARTTVVYECDVAPVDATVAPAGYSCQQSFSLSQEINVDNVITPTFRTNMATDREREFNLTWMHRPKTGNAIVKTSYTTVPMSKEGVVAINVREDGWRADVVVPIADFGRGVRVKINRDITF